MWCPIRIVYRIQSDHELNDQTGFTGAYDMAMFAYQIDLRADNHETSRAYALDNLI